MADTAIRKILDQDEDNKWRIFSDRVPVPQPHDAERPLAIITSVGDFGMGKSFLNNILLNHLKLGENCFLEDEEIPHVFRTEQTQESETKGIDMYNGYLEPHVDQYTERPNICGQTGLVTLWDTEGASDPNQPQDHAVTVFGLAAYFSSVLIYNLDKKFTTSNIDKLKVFMQEMRKNTGDSSAKVYQDLVIVVRDFPDDPRFGYCWDGGKKYLDFMKEGENTNAFLQELENTFRSVLVFLMPAPTGVVTIRGGRINRMNELDPLFRDSIRILAKQITHEILQPRIINGESLKAGDLATELVKVEAKFASNDEPRSLTFANALKEDILKGIINKCFNDYQGELVKNKGWFQWESTREERSEKAANMVIDKFKVDVQGHFIEPRVVVAAQTQLIDLINKRFSAYNKTANRAQKAMWMVGSVLIGAGAVAIVVIFPQMLAAAATIAMIPVVRTILLKAIPIVVSAVKHCVSKLMGGSDSTLGSAVMVMITAAARQGQLALASK